MANSVESKKIALSDITYVHKELTTEQLTNKLKDYGVLLIENFASSHQLENMQSEFKALLAHSGAPWLEKRAYSLGEAVLVTRNKDMDSFSPESFSFFDQPFMKEITDLYLGKGFTPNKKIFVVKDVVGSLHHANDLHFDVERTLKFFLYLTDTNSLNGAFRCVPASHKHTEKIRKDHGDKISYENREFSRQLPFGPEHTISIDGKAGTLIIFDTDVFHQTGKVTQGERWVMRGQTEDVGKHKSEKPSLLKRLFGK